MIDIKVSRIQPWKFGDICDGCGAPMVPYCATCGADLFTTGHGAIYGRGLPEGYLLAACDACIDRFNAGLLPTVEGGFLAPRKCE
jgi:hypothetical protein